MRDHGRARGARALGHARLVYAGSKYHNHSLSGWVAQNGWYELGMVRRPWERRAG